MGFVRSTLVLAAAALAQAQSTWPFVAFQNHQLFGSSFGAPAVNASYDYVIVGGGTAGLTIATRLAQNPNITVAVVEAGTFYEIANSNVSQIPAFDAQSANATSLIGVNPLIDWRFTTTPQPQLNNKVFHFVRGKCLGGSSARNYMLYNRATVGAMQKWADEVGDDSYEWNNVLQYYQKSCNYTMADAALRPANQSVANDTGAFIRGGGPLKISYPNWANPLGSYYPSAYEQVGLKPLPGINTGELIGWAVPTSVLDPDYETRSSSQTSFLNLALQTTRLQVYPSTMVQQIIFDSNKTATGIIAQVAGLNFTLTARKEVILSAGAVQSPQLLQVSGIGPASMLKNLGIPVVKDLPGVGQNMQDNPLYFVSYSTPYVIPPATLNNYAPEYIFNKTGPLTNPGTQTAAFDKALDKPWSNASASTIQAFNDAYPADWPEVQLFSSSTGATLVGLLTTFSRGNISINSTSMNNPPIISPNWLSDPRDQELAVAAFRYVRQLENTTSLKQLLINGETNPGPAVQSDAQILTWIKNVVTSLYHASATCKMGRANDSMAVVDSHARVFGVNSLRVVDVSAMPFLVPGQPQSAVYMLAEKISAEILAGLGRENSTAAGYGHMQRLDQLHDLMSH